LRAFRLSAPLLLLAAACAKHAPEPTPHPSAPHVTWSIAEGYGGEKEACRSTKEPSCLLDLSGVAPNRRFAVFHLFLHSAAADTRYAGTANIGFIGQVGQAGHASKIEWVVPRGRNPINFSTTGIVRSPGTYFVDVSLTATPAKGSGTPVPLKIHIQVDVK
jgi:hypothetical protein